MLAHASCGLFEEMDKVGRAQFAEGDERFGASVNRLLEYLLRNPAQCSVSQNERDGRSMDGWMNEWKNRWVLPYSGTAGATISTTIKPLPWGWYE